jgi:hypothetical protein
MSGPDRTATRFSSALGSVAVLAGIVAAALAAGHAVRYFPLYDDFAALGLSPRISWTRLLEEGLGGFFRPLGALLFRVQAEAFGVARPWGPAFVSVVLHGLATVLVALALPRRAALGPLRLAAVALFVASPWATEARYWVSAQFDLLATLGIFGAFLSARRWTAGASGRGAGWLALSIAATLLGVAAKEIAVAIPALTVLLCAAGSGASWRDKRLLSAVGAQSVVVLAFLLFRQRLLPNLAGPYGEFGELARGGAWLENLSSHLMAFLRPPLGPDGGLEVVLVAVWIAALGCLLAAALRDAPRPTALRLAALLVGFAPILVMRTGAEAIAGGRVLYLPGALLVLALVPAQEEGSDARPWRAVAWAALLAVALVSLVHQQALWRAATRLSRHVVASFEEHLGTARPIFIENLPGRFERGPNLLKIYAFRFYYRDAPVPPVRARLAVLAPDAERLRVVGFEEDVFSGSAEPRAGEQVISLPLSDAWLRDGELARSGRGSP